VFCHISMRGFILNIADKTAVYGKPAILSALCALTLVACNGRSSQHEVGEARFTPADAGNSLVKVKLTRVMPDFSFDQPVFMLQAPDDNDSFYVVLKKGVVYRLQRDGASSWHKQEFFDISHQVDASASEAGLLSMAFDPQFHDNGYLYVSYTAQPRKTHKPAVLESRLSRLYYNAKSGKLNIASENVILRVDQPYANHNGGHIAFSPQGYLMWGLGDGGSGGDPQGNGQNSQTLLGSLLRLDVRQLPYQIPADNPFAKGGGRREIFAMGLRNPWRYSFDSNSGQLWLADVGQNNWEEIDLVQAGDNLGWNGKEGKHCYVHDLCVNNHYKDPILEYDHSAGNCSITGGYVYRGKASPSLRGLYFYADYCSGEISAVMQAGEGDYRSMPLLKSGLNIASFAQDNQGELYVINLGGSIFRIDAGQ